MSILANEFPRRGSLPILNSFSSNGSLELTEDRRLPPLPSVDPLPRGPFNPFTPQSLTTPPSPQHPFPATSACLSPIAAPPSPVSADNSFHDSFASQKSDAWPGNLSQSEILSLVAPRHTNRKPPLQQLCGQKRKSSMISELDDQREKHRIAEGNRRKNLSQLHRELDSRLHDFFLIQAGWNPSRNLPQSKEHIVQGTIFLIDFMHSIIFHLMNQESEMPEHLTEKLQPQVRCMQLQQLVSSLQQQTQTTEQQLEALRQDKKTLEKRNHTLERQMKSYDHIFQTPKTESHSPQPLSTIPETKQRQSSLPSVRDLCEDIDVPSPKSARQNSWIGSSRSLGTSFLSTTPPMTGPFSYMPPPSFSSVSWRD